MVNTEDPAPALLALRTTPGKDNTTPAKKLMGHILRTDLLLIKPPLKTLKPTTMLKTTTVHYRTYLYFTLATTYASGTAETGRGKGQRQYQTRVYDPTT